MAANQTLIDVEALAAALPDADAPCGPDLEYDPDFIALLVAAAGKPERQSGESLIPAEEPDWPDVRQRAVSLLGRTKDVRLAVLLTRGLTRSAGMEGLAAGLELIRELLSRHWDHLHPALDAAENLDPTMRLNALAPLIDSDAVLADLRLAFLLPAGHPRRISVREVLGLLGKLPPAEGGPTEVEMENILTEAAGRSEVPTAAVRAALQSTLDIRTLLVDKVGSGQATDLAPLSDTLKALAQWLDKVLGVDADAEPGDGADGAVGAPSAARSGEIRSREDAVRLLDRVCSFLERTEPTNPAPLFIRRAQQLLTMRFMDIVQDLAPDSLGQIKKMVGLDRE